MTHLRSVAFWRLASSTRRLTGATTGAIGHTAAKPCDFRHPRVALRPLWTAERPYQMGINGLRPARGGGGMMGAMEPLRGLRKQGPGFRTPVCGLEAGMPGAQE